MVFPQNRNIGTQIEWHDDGTASVTKASGMTGKTHTLTMKMQKEDYDSWVRSHVSIQDVLPNLSPDEREFLMTGITQEEWAKVFEEDNECSD